MVCCAVRLSNEWQSVVKYTQGIGKMVTTEVVQSRTGQSDSGFGMFPSRDRF